MVNKEKTSENKTAVPTPGRLAQHYREVLGLSQKEAARRIGTSNSRLSDIERGITTMTEKWRTRIAPVYEVHPDDLLEGTPLRDDTHRALISIFDNMTPEQRQAELIRLAKRK